MQISKDDLIGCASLPLSELQDGCFEGWKEIIVPFATAKKSSISNLSGLKSSELKLKVHVSVTRNTIDCFKLAGPAVEEVVPLARLDSLDNHARMEAQIHGELGSVEEFLDSHPNSAT